VANHGEFGGVSGGGLGGGGLSGPGRGPPLGVGGRDPAIETESEQEVGETVLLD
jgi:hypothetical protein